MRFGPSFSAAPNIANSGLMLDGSSLQFCHWPAQPPPAPVQLVTIPPEPCVYLPDRQAQIRAFHVDQMSPERYQDFLDAAFRRSGRIFYQPVCQKCRQCIPLRVIVNQFNPNRSQRRRWRRNQDLLVTINTPEPTDEKWQLYQQYQVQWPHRPAEDSRESFESFLYDSPVQTIEFQYRDAGGELLAVSICDVSRQYLSSVYCWFNPLHTKRGLGTFAALGELAYARRREIDYYYLGYRIALCRKMAYKSAFRPHELLWPDGVWRLSDSQNKSNLTAFY